MVKLMSILFWQWIKKDIDTYKKLKDLGVKFDVRKVPSDGKQNMDELLIRLKIS